MDLEEYYERPIYSGPTEPKESDYEIKSNLPFVLNAISIFFWFMALMALMMGIMDSLGDWTVYAFMFCPFGVIMGIIFGFLFKKAEKWLAKKTDLAYKNALETYEKDAPKYIEKYNKDVEAFKQSVIEKYRPQYEKSVKYHEQKYDEYISQKISKEQEIDELCKITGNLPHKYRTKEIVNKLIEYLSADRCKTVGDAINILENEVRNRIVFININIST